MRRIAVALLCLGAFVLLLEILTGSRYHDATATKAFETAIVFAFVSLAVGAGANLIARQPGVAAIGRLTVVVGGIAMLLSANTIWRGSLSDAVTSLDHWTWYTLVGTIALGIASTLIAGHDDRDADGVKLVRGLTVFALFALFVAIVDELRVSGQRVDPYLLGSLAVLYLLGSLVLPLLSRITAGEVSSAEGLLAGLDHVVIGVTDRARADRFYGAVLSAGIETDAAGRTAYRIGSQRLNVHEAGSPAQPLAADPVRPGNSDLCFAWAGDAESAIRHLHSHGVPIVAGPVARTGARGAGVSVYCRDPDGSLIELISYR